MAEEPNPEQLDEFALKRPYWSSSVVDARLRATFPGPEQSDAAVLLSTLVGEVPDAEPEASDVATCRLMLDALKVSEGLLPKLAMWVEAARLDPRDLMASAEYRRELLGEGGSARIDDLAEYLAWLDADE